MIRAVYEEPLVLTYAALQMLPAHALVIIGQLVPTSEWQSSTSVSEIAETMKSPYPTHPLLKALAIAMESHITIHGKIVLSGLDGLASPCAMFEGLGADVSVVARRGS